MSESSYYYYTPAFTEKERQSLEDFFGRDLFGSYSPTAKELTDEQIDQISSRFMSKARSSLRAVDLLPTLRKFKALTETEYMHLKSGSLEPQEQAGRLLEYLMYKGSYGLAALYLSLLSSSGRKGGLPAHYQLAVELKDIVQEYSVCDEDTTSIFESPAQGSEQTISLRAAIKKLQGITISAVAAQALASCLNLSSRQTSITNLYELCQTWLSSRTTCDMTELVEGMVVTEGVGRYTSHLCGPATMPPRDLRNFLLTLGERWVEFAKYLGFTSDEIAAITDNYPYSVGKQVDSFLEKWKMPDSGQKTLPLMHKLKALAGIVEPKRETERLPSTRRPQIDSSGVPPRRLDPYPHPTRISQPSHSTPPHSHSHSQSHSHYNRTGSQQHSHTGSGGLYDDCENTHTHFCSTHGRYTTSHRGGTLRLTIVQGMLPEEEMVTSSRHSRYLAGQDPVIEELPSDSSQPRSKLERCITENEVTVPDRPSRSLPTPTRLSDSPKSTPRSEAERMTSNRVLSKTEPKVLLGNEVPTRDHSSPTSSSWGMGGKRDSLQFGNEVTLPSGAASVPLGNEVFVGPRGSGGSTSSLGMKSKVVTGEQGGRGHKEGGTGNKTSWGLLGNEVSVPGSRGSYKLGNEVSPLRPLSTSGAGLGNEAPPPGVGGRAGNSVRLVENRVSVQSSLSVGVDRGGRGPSRTLLGNEVDTDNGYTTASIESEPTSLTTFHSSAGRKQLRSDSSSDSTTGSRSHKSTVEPRNLEACATVGENASVRRDISPSIESSRASSPDNDLSSGDEKDSVSPSTTSSSGLQTSSAPSSNQPPVAGAQPSPRVSALMPGVAQSLPSAGRTSGQYSGSPLQSVPSSQVSHIGDAVNTGSEGIGFPTNESNQPHDAAGIQGSGVSVGANEVFDEGDNDLDEEKDEAEVPKPTPTTPASLQLAVPLQAHTQHSHDSGASFQPEQTGGEERGNGREEIDNDLSAPTPETAQARALSEPVFAQSSSTNYTLPPDNESAVADDPTLSITSQLNNVSTHEEAVPTTEMTHPLPAAECETNEEFCSEDVIQAIQDRDGMDMLTALIDSGADINLPIPNGSYPIHLAVETGRHQTVLFLLNRGANVNEQRSDGKTPLHVACLHKDFEMTQILVEKGADVKAQDKQGYTCLHFKETLETLTTVKYLAHNGALVNTPSHDSYLTPLMMCCCVGNELFETAHFLVIKGADVNGFPQAGMKPLIIACTEGFEVLVDLLLDNSANINILDHDGNSALLKACQGGFLGIARKLCERRSDSNSVGAEVNHANSEGLTPIMAAVLGNRIELVKTLVSHGAFVNCYKVQKLSVGGSDVMLEMSPLASTAARGNMEMVELLVQSRASVNASATAMAPVAFAAMCGQVAVVDYFLKLNDLDLSLRAIAQPFTQAVRAKQRQCAELMAEKYGSLERMYGDAIQSSMQDLANSIMQLQQMQQQSGETETTAPSLVQSTLTGDQHSQPHTEISFTNNLAPSQPRHEKEHDGTGDEDLNNLSADEEEEENDLDDGEPTTVTQSGRDNSYSSPTPTQENTSTRDRGVIRPPEPVDISVPHGGMGSPDVEAENNLDIDEVAGYNAEEENNLDVDEMIGHRVETEKSLDADEAVGGGVETENNLKGDEVMNSEVELQNNDIVVGPADVEVQNNLDVEAENNLDSDEEAENHVSHPTSKVSQLPQPYSTPHTASSAPSSNGVNPPLSTQSPPMSRSQNRSTTTEPMQAFRATVPRTTDSHTLVLNHDLTEENQFEEDDEKQNNFSDSEASDHGPDLQGLPHANDTAPQDFPPPSSLHPQQQTRASQEENNFVMPPMPMSAPVGRGFSDSTHHSGGPLRANVDSTTFSSLPSSASGGENLFAPRPKSPPPCALSPPPPVVPHNMPTMVDTPTGLHQGGVDVLHDFAQICMSAVVRTKGQEWLINKATETGYEHLTQFFIQFFHEGMTLSMGGKLVSEFIGGNPSPLNFLLAGRFINQKNFEDVATELGQPDFMDSLTVALHHFPGSDGLPYTGSEMGAALFNQTFSIGHRYPNASSLWSSPSSSPRLQRSSSSQPSFPGQGHRLGNRDTTEYSNLSEPAFHSAGAGGSGSTGSTQQLSGSLNSFTLPHTPVSTQTPNSAHTTNAAPLNNTPPQSPIPLQLSQPEPTQLPSTTTLPTQPPSVPSQPVTLSPSPSLAHSSSTDSVTEQNFKPPAATADSDNVLSVRGTSLNPPKPVFSHPAHTLTEENVFDDEPQNDLTTADEDCRGYFVRKTHTDEGQLLGNEIEVSPVSLSRPQTQTSVVSVTHTPMNPSPPKSLTPSPPSTTDVISHTGLQQPADKALSLTPSPPPVSTAPPVVLPAKGSDVLSSSLAWPVARPAPTDYHTSPAFTSKVATGTVGSFPQGLTPSPDMPETPLHEQTIHKVLNPAVSGTNTPLDVSPHSSYGFQSPRSSSPPVSSHLPQHISAPVEKTVKPVSRPLSGSSTGSRESRRTKPSTSPVNKGKESHTHSKAPRGASLGRGKTAPTSAGSSRTKQPGSVSKPPATSTSVGKKGTELGSSARTKASTLHSKSVSPRTGSKVAVALPKGRSQLQAKLSKTSSLQSHAGGSAENLHAKTSARKSLPPSASKPPPSYPNKVNGVRTKVGRVSTVGAITHTTSMSRGLQRAKGSSAGTSASSLTDEDTADSDYRSVPFRSLEPANGSDVTPSCDSERCNDSGVYECDGITFPDAVIQNPDSCTLFPVLAHRVRKWKIFGRYLGLSDSELDIIESSNHFTTERCLKMLVHWGKKHRGKYSELEASLHNIMREDLIEDVRPYLPSGRAQQCSPVEEENGHLLKFSGFKVEGGSPNIHKLAATVSEFVKRSSECSKILLHFSHAKLYRPIVLYLPFSTSSSRDCDLTVVEELCFAAWMRSASIVDLVFEIK